MTTGTTFEIIITALDKASAPLQLISKRVAGIAAPFRSMTKSLGSIGEATGLASLSGALGSMSGQLGAIAGVAAGGGLIAMVRHSADYGAQLYDAAQKTGVAVAELQKLQYAAEKTDVPIEQMDKGLEFLNRTIGQTVSGKNKNAASWFAAMHINLRNANGTVKSAGVLFSELAGHFAKNSNFAQKSAAAVAIFGRSGADLLPVLDAGKEKMNEWGNEVVRLRGAMDEGGAQSAHDTKESWEQLDTAAGGLSQTIGGVLTPVLTPLVKGLTEWISHNRKLAAGIIIFGGGAIALGGTLALLTPAFMALGTAVWFVAGRMMLLPVASLIGSIVSLIPMIGSMADAWAALDLVLDANPLGLIVIGVAALGVAAYEIYKHWSPISKFFENLWHDAVHWFEWAWDKIRPIVNFIAKPAAWLWDRMGGAAGVAMGIGEAVIPGAGLIAPTLEFAQAVAAHGTAVGKASGNAVQAMKYFMGNGWSKAQSAGIVANLQYEGSLNPAKRQVGGGPGYGIAQWTLGGDRARNFEAFSGHALVGSSLASQLAFVNYELTKGSERAAGAWLHRTNDPSGAALAMLQGYERPKNPSGSALARTSIAQSLFSRNQNGKVDVNVNFQNTPRGTKVASRASGKSPPSLVTGLAFEPG